MILIDALPKFVNSSPMMQVRFIAAHSKGEATAPATTAGAQIPSQGCR